MSLSLRLVCRVVSRPGAMECEVVPRPMPHFFGIAFKVEKISELPEVGQALVAHDDDKEYAGTVGWVNPSRLEFGLDRSDKAQAACKAFADLSPGAQQICGAMKPPPSDVESKSE